MDYGEILSRAWKIIWKHKILWIFGILAGCGRAGGNSGSGARGNVNYQTGSSNLPPDIQNWFNNLGHFIENIPVWVWIILALALLVLIVIGILLSTVGQIGLIQGANLADQGAGRLSFGSLFSDGLAYFWRIFFLNLIVGLAFFVVIIILIFGMVLLGIATLGIGLLCLVPFICILIPVSWVVSVIVQQANIAIVTEDLGIMAGLQRAWQVVTGNLGQYIVMAIILGVGSFIISLVFGLPLVLIALPAILTLVAGTTSSGLLVSLILFLIYLPILIILNGILTAYITSAWTLTFRRITGRLPGGTTTLEGASI